MQLRFTETWIAKIRLGTSASIMLTYGKIFLVTTPLLPPPSLLHSFYDHDLIHGTNSDLTFRVRVISQVISLNPMIQYRYKKTTRTQGVHTIKLTKIILTLSLKKINNNNNNNNNNDNNNNNNRWIII